jgi:hypothetical protein
MYNNHKTKEKNQCLNICDLDFYSEVHELTDDDLNNTNGSGLGALGGATGSILDNVFNRKPINWRSAAAWGIGGAIAGSAGGPVGAALAGED